MTLDSWSEMDFISSHEREVLIMSNRRKYEGEEELQLKLLEVTEDPAFGKPNRQHQGVLAVRGKLGLGKPDEAEPRETKVLH